jgi:hypothetical protein
MAHFSHVWNRGKNMLGLPTFDVTEWTTWAAVGAGAAVTGFVVSGGVMYGRWRRRRGFDASREEDLPWDVILDLVEKHNRARAAAGMPPEELTEQLLGQLVTKMPTIPNPGPLELPEDRDFQSLGGVDRRAGRRRWGNPTEVHLRSFLWAADVHGLVVNRSTGGLGIYTDEKVVPGTSVRIGAVGAPDHIPWAGADVRHCRKVGKGFLLGCEFSSDVPWNIRVWFG